MVKIDPVVPDVKNVKKKCTEERTTGNQKLNFISELCNLIPLYMFLC